MQMFNPAHPGEVLQEWFEGREITEVARQLGVARSTLSRILNCHAGVSADMSIRLSEYLKTSPGLFVNMQVQYDLWHAMQARKAARRAARASGSLAPKRTKSSVAKLAPRQPRVRKAA